MDSYILQLKAFETALRTAEPREATTFAKLIEQSAEVLQLTLREVAFLLDVSPSSVTRWVQGRTLPHPAMRGFIRDRLVTKVQSRLQGLRRGASRPKRRGASLPKPGSLVSSGPSAYPNGPQMGLYAARKAKPAKKRSPNRRRPGPGND